jgi:hypothetical protein
MRRTTAIATALLVLIPGLSVAQVSPLRVSVNVREYFGELYTGLPKDGGSFVFFPGEPIDLLLAIGNTDSESSHEIVTAAGNPQTGFVLNGLRNRQPVALTISITPVGELRDNLAVFPLDWGSRTSLNPLAHVEWRATVGRGQSLQPGVYVLEISTSAVDEQSRVIPSVNHFSFEVRERTVDSELELLRRQGFRELARGDYQAAANTARELLARHSNSSQAHILLGDIADAEHKEFSGRGDLARARQSFRQATSSYERALTLLEAGADTQLRRPGEVVTSRAIEHLRTRVRAQEP